MNKNRSLRDIYTIINRNTLPPELRNYYLRPLGKKFDLAADIKELKLLLLKYRASTKKEEVNSYIFLAILGLFSGEYKLSLFFIRKAEGMEMSREETWLMMEIKYSIRKLDKILVLVSKPRNEDENEAIALTSIKDLAKRINRTKNYSGYHNKLVVRYVSTITAADLNQCFKKYEQLFIVGHGNDVSMELGGKTLRLIDIVSKLNNKIDKPNVLGMFSCGEAFNKKDVWENVDYFITDTSQSTPVFFEMFLYGYITSYYRNQDVLKAFDSGRILPAIRAIGDPYYVLRERGEKIKP